jgi:hypothetical protein
VYSYLVIFDRRIGAVDRMVEVDSSSFGTHPASEERQEWGSQSLCLRGSGGRSQGTRDALSNPFRDESWRLSRTTE